MKRRMTAALLILAALCLFWCSVLAGEEDWEFDTETGTDGYKIMNYKGTEQDVTIPSSHNGKPVVAIALESMAGKTMQTVRIPSSITRLGEGSFDSCKNLTVVLPAGDGEIHIPVINICTFEYCSKLTDISHLLKHAEQIRSMAFFSCTSLKSVIIPENVKSIEEEAFASCVALTDITVLNRSVTFEKDVFRDDRNLTIHGYKGSTAETYAKSNGIPFVALTWTVSFNANGGSGTMADQSVCRGEKYTLPACAFTAPAGKMFDAWDKGASGSEIEISADTVITALWKDVPAPATATVGGIKYALSRSNAIVTGPKSRNAKKLTIPASIKVRGKNYKVTEIRANAFSGMKKLTTVTIGANVKTIGKQAFRKCPKLTKITIKTKKLTSSSVKSNAFQGIHKKATFLCPKGKARAYKKILLMKGAPKTCTFR